MIRLFTPKYKYSLKKRTIFYFFIGCFCVFADYLAFIKLSKIIDPIFANFIAYLLGSIFSFLLNKKYTFKSKNSDLSFYKYCVIIFLGFTSSNLVIYFGVYILNLANSLNYIKFLAILAAVTLQYLGNTFFGSNARR